MAAEGEKRKSFPTSGAPLIKMFRRENRQQNLFTFSNANGPNKNDENSAAVSIQ